VLEVPPQGAALIRRGDEPKCVEDDLNLPSLLARLGVVTNLVEEGARSAQAVLEALSATCRRLQRSAALWILAEVLEEESLP
jgi:hypothetical protein